MKSVQDFRKVKQEIEERYRRIYEQELEKVLEQVEANVEKQFELFANEQKITIEDCCIECPKEVHVTLHLKLVSEINDKIRESGIWVEYDRDKIKVVVPVIGSVW